MAWAREALKKRIVESGESPAKELRPKKKRNKERRCGCVKGKKGGNSPGYLASHRKKSCKVKDWGKGTAGEESGGRRQEDRATFPNTLNVGCGN